jgi:hypothetical protein
MKANTSGYQVRYRFHVRNGHPVSTASIDQKKQKKEKRRTLQLKITFATTPKATRLKNLP